MFRIAFLAALTLYFAAGCADEADAQCQGGSCAIGPGVQYDVTQSVVVRERVILRPLQRVAEARPVRRLGARVLQAQPVRRVLAARPRILGRVFGRGCG